MTTVAAGCSSSQSSAVVMRLGTVAGNSSLDKLGLDKFETERPKVTTAAAPIGFSAEYESIISSIYRQVFGNAYIMESERAEMAKAESEFRDMRMTVKEFIRCLAKSEQYKKRFFDARPLYAAIELNFKHFLGRTPDGLEQYRAKSAVYDASGYEAFVDAFFDDGEYDEVFDDYEVPYYRGFKTEANLSMAAFTHFFTVVRGASTSDKSNPAMGVHGIPLNYYGISATPLAVVAPGSAGSTYNEGFQGVGSWNGGQSGLNAARTVHGTPAAGRSFRVEVTGFSQQGATFGRSGVQLATSGKVYNTKKYSTMPRSNKSYIVSFDELSPLYKRVAKMGGKIASITPV
eukprot:CAMPEP_0185848298 /NCGR_PEP_ID=MMETSP1354-20130828/3239_1 /TAXON_ID=708628 /ORGANISM="Erythrolobus madagascarensis, Strain CCMP3276" /LENGTH=344 /DNA_ID=CAMNT_0028548685 /DNA_START=127 /DNA_END=1161 /DNA_ORIENTATION=-